MRAWGGCEYRTKSGRRCLMPAMKGKNCCQTHDPDPGARERLRLSRAKGGKVRAWNVAKARALALSSLAPEDTIHSPEDVRALLSKTLDGVAMGKIDPRLAGQIAYLGAACLKAFEAIRETALLERAADPIHIELKWPTYLVPESATWPKEEGEVLAIEGPGADNKTSDSEVIE